MDFSRFQRGLSLEGSSACSDPISGLIMGDLVNQEGPSTTLASRVRALRPPFFEKLFHVRNRFWASQAIQGTSCLDYSGKKSRFSRTIFGQVPRLSPGARSALDSSDFSITLPRPRPLVETRPGFLGARPPFSLQHRTSAMARCRWAEPEPILVLPDPPVCRQGCWIFGP